MNTQEIQTSFITQVNESNALSANVKKELEKSLRVDFAESRITPASRPQWCASGAENRAILRLYHNGTVLVYYSRLEHPLMDVEDSNKFKSFDLKKDDGYRRLITDIKANLFSK